MILPITLIFLLVSGLCIGPANPRAVLSVPVNSTCPVPTAISPRPGAPVPHESQTLSSSDFQGFVKSVTFGQDSSILVSGAYDGGIHIWNAGSGNLKRTMREQWHGHNLPVESLALSPDGRTLAVVAMGTGGSVRGSRISLWDIRTGKRQRILWQQMNGDDVPGPQVCFAPGGRSLAAAGAWEEPKSGHKTDGVLVWNVRTGRLQQRFVRWVRPLGKLIQTLPDTVSYSADGRTMVSCDGDVVLWDTRTGRLKRSLTTSTPSGGSATVSGAVISPDGRVEAGWDPFTDSAMRVWDARSGKLLHVFTVPKDGFNSGAFSPNSRCLAGGGCNPADPGQARLWDVRSGKLLHVWKGPSLAVESVAFSPNGRLLAGGSLDTRVYLWRLP